MNIMKEYEVVFEIEEGRFSFTFSSNSSRDVIKEKAKSLVEEYIHNEYKLVRKRFRIISVDEISNN